MTEYDDRLTYWQRRLRIMDWDLSLAEVPVDELSSELGCGWGAAAIERTRRRAMVHLAMHRGPDEIEITLVHELLHVLLDPLDAEFDLVCSRLGPEAAQLAACGWEEAEHRIIEILAKALVALANQVDFPDS